MDVEMFTTEHYGGADKPAPLLPETTGTGHVYVAAIKLMHTTKLMMRAILVLIVVWMIFKLFTEWIPLSILYWKHGLKEPQKDTFQWLGASKDIIRGDYENNQDSLAERAMMTDRRVTDMTAPAAPAKLTFLSREHYSTPEEELMRRQQEGK